MRFLMTINGGGPQADEQLYADMAKFVEELSQAGVLLATGGLGMDGHPRDAPAAAGSHSPTARTPRPRRRSSVSP